MSREMVVELSNKNGLSKNSYGAISSLMTDRGNSYGPVLMMDDKGGLCIRPEVKRMLASIGWK